MESDRLSNTLSDCARDGQQQGQPLHGRTGGPTRRSTKGQWSAEEDEILRTAVQRFKGKNWKKIAECFKERTDVQCLHRWQKVLNPDLVKGPWSKEEDEIIIEMVKKYGPKKWSTIAQHLPGRIGKQCRERWHNHLNPNINKQAWTQEEELALIRAHQVYGNKWAELTKHLPGRTDNAIKNHWNSSVKKKLDMYVTSGLLSQFQGPPLVNHSAASSSSKALQSGEDDDSDFKGKREMDELSESSQPSRNNRIAHPIVDLRAAEESSQFPCSQEYHNELQQDTFSMSEKFLEHDLSLDWPTFAGKHWQLDSNELHDMSLLDLGQESTDLFMPSLDGTASHESVPVPIDTPGTLVASNSMIDMVMGTDALNFIDTGQDGCFNSQHANEDSLLYINANYQMPEDGNFASQSFYMPETSFNQPFSIPTQLPPDDCRFCENPLQNTYTSLENAHEVLISDYIPCENNSNNPKESPRIVANDFVLSPATDSQCISFKGKNVTESDEEKESGALFYEPPRCLSLDVPFFSCDLVQSGTDMNQDYSPLGIRQLMISSSMMTPLKLWDSPSRDDDNSPESVLRSAAKTFAGTPSILKKRSRDLVSPVSEKRGEKKQELSNLRNDSRLEAMFNECVNTKEAKPLLGENTEGNFDEHCTDKENVDPGQKNGMTNESIVISKTEGGIAEMKTGKDCTGILVERDTNDVLFLSPDHFGIKSDREIGLSARALGNRYARRLDSISKNGAILSSAETSCFSLLCSPRLSTKNNGANLVITTTSLQSLSPTEKKVITSCSSVAFESNSILVETPFKSNMESPPAWKSPWLFNTFVPGPRVDTDITVEDIGYLLSPTGERSYDAIGLMKQLGERTASAFADAQEVLGDETPETIMKEKSFTNKEEAEKENGHASNSNADQLQAVFPSKLMTGRRTLDFNECGTPVKHTEKFSSSTSHSSPCSYLLKNCR